MGLRISYRPVRLADGRRIHLFKLDRGALKGDWEVQQIVSQMKQRLSGADRLPDIVLMEGEPTDNPRLLGSGDSVAQIRSMLAGIASHAWAPATLDD